MVVAESEYGFCLLVFFIKFSKLSIIPRGWKSVLKNLLQAWSTSGYKNYTLINNSDDERRGTCFFILIISW